MALQPVKKIRNIAADQIVDNAVTASKLNDDDFFVEQWALTENHFDDSAYLGASGSSSWAPLWDYKDGVGRHPSLGYGAGPSNRKMLNGSYGDATGEDDEYFKFPQTGVYRVSFLAAVRSDAADNTMYAQIQFRANSLGYDYSLHRSYSSASGTNYHTNFTTSTIIHVDDIANDRIRFIVASISAGDYVIGSDTSNEHYQTNVMFQRLGNLP